MSDMDAERVEQELKRFEPAKPPQEFVARLSSALENSTIRDSGRVDYRPSAMFNAWWRVIRWLAPAGIAAAVAAALWVHRTTPPAVGVNQTLTAVPKKPTLKADRVEIDRQLVGAFDAVTRLPDGEPVRFRCRQWMDQVVFRDSSRGVVVERRSPRLEVVPVGFETY